jgi:hypothetical protein
MWQLCRSASRRLPRTSLGVISPMTPFARYHSELRVETFPGAACYKTLGSAMALRAIMRAVWQRSKAAPLQDSLRRRATRGQNESRNL